MESTVFHSDPHASARIQIGTFDTENKSTPVSKRFVKKQQMRWTQRGAHLLLQTRVQVLNNDLRNTFCRWFPGMKTDEQVELKAA